jgi:predicted transcriptional regulator
MARGRQPHAAGGAEVRRVRRSLDLTQWDLAALAQVSQATIVRAERGLPTGAAVLQRILAALLAAEAQRKR